MAMAEEHAPQQGAQFGGTQVCKYYKAKALLFHVVKTKGNRTAAT